MPWLAVDYNRRDLADALSTEFQSSHIPFLVLLAPDGQIITTSGVEHVRDDPEGVGFPWGSQSCLPGGQPGGSIDDAQHYVIELAASQLARNAAKSCRRGQIDEQALQITQSLLETVESSLLSCDPA